MSENGWFVTGPFTTATPAEIQFTRLIFHEFLPGLELPTALRGRIRRRASGKIAATFGLRL